MSNWDDSNWPLNEDGVWIETRRKPHPTPGPVLFLDRDGVITEDRGYVKDPADVALMPGAAKLISAANEKDIPVAVITNQSGIDRSLFGWAEFAAVTARIDDMLAAERARIDAVAACPFHPDFTPGYGARQNGWRKPAPRMIVETARRLNADLGASWMIGDRSRDMAAAEAAGLRGAIQIGTGSPVSSSIEIRVARNLDQFDQAVRRVIFGD